MIIPWQQLEAETLNNLIEYYILREGTDYGVQEVSLEQKVTQVQQQLRSGEVLLVFSELHETVNLMSKQQFTEQQP